MTKITVMLKDEVEQALREYVTKKYPTQPFGKLSEVVNEAVDYFLQKPVVEGKISYFEPFEKYVIEVQPQTIEKAGLAFMVEDLFKDHIGENVRVRIEKIDS